MALKEGSTEWRRLSADWTNTDIFGSEIPIWSALHKVT